MGPHLRVSWTFGFVPFAQKASLGHESLPDVPVNAFYPSRGSLLGYSRVVHSALFLTTSLLTAFSVLRLPLASRIVTLCGPQVGIDASLYLSHRNWDGSGTHSGIIFLSKSHAIAGAQAVAAWRNDIASDYDPDIPHPLLVEIRRLQVRPLRWSHTFRTMSLLSTFVKNFGLTPSSGK